MAESFLSGLFGSKKQVGLYMASETLCVIHAQSASGAKGVVVLGSAEIPGTNDLSDPDLSKNEPLLTKIKTAIRQANVSGRYVSMAVPSEGSMIRYFELPILPKKEEKNAVRFEAQKFIPFDIKDVYYDYESYPSVSQKKLGVVFFACKKQWIDTAANLLMSLGLQLERAELVSQSVARAFYRSQPSPSGAAEILVTPTDDKTAELILFKGDSVLMTRHLSLMNQPDSSSWDVAFFISEIRITLDYFYENFKEEKVTKIHLAIGQAADVQPLQEALQHEFSLPVNRRLGFPSVFENDKPATPGMVAAYGLTLGTLRPGKGKKINLSPMTGDKAQTISWADEKKQLQDTAVKSFLGVIALFFCVYLLLANVAGSAQAELRAAMSAYPKAMSATMEEPLESLKSKEVDLTQKAAFASNLVDHRNFLTAKMNALVNAVPRTIRLTLLKFTGGTDATGIDRISLHLDGFVISAELGEDLSTVNKFVKQLLSDKDFMQGFSDIKIGSTKREQYKESTATRFSLDGITSQGNKI